MICPHCKYSHNEFDLKSKTTSEGENGEFYKLPIEMTRQVNYHRDAVNIFGCPECKKVFIE